MFPLKDMPPAISVAVVFPPGPQRPDFGASPEPVVCLKLREREFLPNFIKFSG
jgi:hypothetical protein